MEIKKKNLINRNSGTCYTMIKPNDVRARCAKKYSKQRRRRGNNNISSKILRLNDNIAVFWFEKRRRRRWRSRQRLSDGLVPKTREQNRWKCTVDQNYNIIIFSNESIFVIFFLFYSCHDNAVTAKFCVKSRRFRRRGRIDAGICNKFGYFCFKSFIFGYGLQRCIEL